MTDRRGVVAIIAGGRAQRLGGQVKSVLEIAGRRIIDRQIEVLASLFSRILVVCNDRSPFVGLNVELVSDRGAAGSGPLAGLDAALAARASDEAAVVCVAGDMPFLDRRALMLLRDHAPDAEAVVARVARRPEPLFARYGAACAPPIAAALAAGRLKTAALLDELQVAWLDEPVWRAMDPQLTFLLNINTPDDLARACVFAATTHRAT